MAKNMWYIVEGRGIIYKVKHIFFSSTVSPGVSKSETTFLLAKCFLCKETLQFKNSYYPAGKEKVIRLMERHWEIVHPKVEFLNVYRYEWGNIHRTNGMGLKPIRVERTEITDCRSKKIDIQTKIITAPLSFCWSCKKCDEINGYHKRIGTALDKLKEHCITEHPTPIKVTSRSFR